MAMTAEQQTKGSLALLKKDTVDLVAAKVQEYLRRGEINLPPDYSPVNALKSAWLILQNTVDREKRPVLQTCTKASIVNALMDMVIQGLNPAKQQCYFIAYGNQLVCQRSYFGTMAVAKMVNPDIADIVAEVVYEGDVFTYKLDRGKKIVTNHEQKLENINPKKIKAAYAMVINHNDEVIATEIMTIDQIKQAWRQSPIHPVDEKGNIKPGTTHDKFTAEMCIRTVINKVCKPIINSSNDAQLLRAVRRSEEIAAEVEAEQEIAENANQQVIDIEPIEEPEENYVPEEAEKPGNGKPQTTNSQRREPQEGQQVFFGDDPGF
ncbi:recombination protein RecT [Thermanaeromonas toyohensis ToBE]|uniref:Recombination protein RecT n=1 Tax=Thermanaeromonas toyohensis ToBE TaxID=698762 RepID=A0A1W1VX88_9FIRM|nr:RecT family recombinase [Thermanaeromonas toyohensis]SMB97999.1 recombination protein RecT [Thermanaeromonas toyohensis ToBE]